MLRESMKTANELEAEGPRTVKAMAATYALDPASIHNLGHNLRGRGMSKEIEPRKTGPGEAVCDENCPNYDNGLCEVDGEPTADGESCRPWEYIKMQILSRGYSW